MKKILILGGSGFLGTYLSKKLIQKDYDVFIYTRNRSVKKLEKISYIYSLEQLPEGLDVIINLAGETIDQRWTVKAKQRIYDSRVNFTKNLINELANLKIKPQSLISASAIGYYTNSYEPIDEISGISDNSFSSKLCKGWENGALGAQKLGIDVTIIRTGVVLASDKGALPKLLFPAKLGFGVKIGSGQQFMSWIHIEDYVDSLIYIIENKLSGIYNLTSPNTVENSEFMNTLCQIIKRPLFLILPTWFVKLIFGQMGEELLLKSSNILPKRLLDAKYKFKFPILFDALSDLLK